MSLRLPTARVAADAGLRVEPVDIALLLDAALLLHDGGFVAERYAAIGEFLDTAPAGAADLDALADARGDAAGALGGDALLLPTTTEHPSLAEIQTDPYSINRRMGTYRNFANLRDMAAVAVPGAPTTSGTRFWVTILARTFDDQIAVDSAAQLSGATPTIFVESGCELAVSDADRRHRAHRLRGRVTRVRAQCLKALTSLR